MCAPFAGRVVTPVAPQSSAQPAQGPPQHKTRRGRSLACPPVARRARSRSNRKAPGRGGGHRRRQASSAAARGGLGLGGSISGAGHRQSELRAWQARFVQLRDCLPGFALKGPMPRNWVCVGWMCGLWWRGGLAGWIVVRRQLDVGSSRE